MPLSLPARALLWVVFASQAAFVPAMLVRAEDDVSMAHNFAVFGVVLALAMAIAGWVRAKRMQISWLLALFANAMVVCAAAGVIDFSGFAGGGHSLPGERDLHFGASGP